jgi:hypothetical protein
VASSISPLVGQRWRFGGGGLDADDTPVDVVLDDARVGRPHLGPEREQALGDGDGGRLPGVAGVLRVGETEQQDARAVMALRAWFKASLARRTS